MNKKRMIINSMFLTLTLILCTITIIAYKHLPVASPNLPVVALTTTNVNSLKNDTLTEEVSKLRAKYNNQDIKGIITIESEPNFNYPIAQSSDNQFYLSHDYYKNYYKYGSIYADYRIDLDNSSKILLFGHNSSYIETPFGQLENYYNQDYYKHHKYIYITTDNDQYKYEIFSVYIETSDFTYMNINFSSEEEWYQHILKLQNKSMYNIDISLNTNDDILIMQTCSNNPNYKNYSKKYLLIISRRVK